MTTSDMNTPNPQKTWFIVSQVKSDRVVYFTDDPEYQPITEGDWYYINPYQGEIPKAMTLRNCWAWRFRKNQLIKATSPPTLSPAQTLLASNQLALHQLLSDKIAAIRKSGADQGRPDEFTRSLLLQEAQQYKTHASTDTLQLLPQAAAVRGLPFEAMADNIIAAHEMRIQKLVDIEIQRDAFTVLIARATDQVQLATLRERIMDELAPETNGIYAVKPTHTTPKQLAATPSDDVLMQEKSRLRIQLRLKINQLRKSDVSDYLLDDIVSKHKARLAQAVLNNVTESKTVFPAGQSKLNGLDLMPLISHGAARGQTIEQAAHEILFDMNAIAKRLLDSEQMKDFALSRIAVIKTFTDISAVSKLIDQLGIEISKKTI